MHTLRLMPWHLSIVQLPSGESFEWLKQSNFFSLTQTLEETSVVCETDVVPIHIKQESGWRVFKIEAILDFNIVGILARLSTTLAAANVSIFTISTYNTDYIMVKNEMAKRALESLTQNGYKVIGDF